MLFLPFKCPISIIVIKTNNPGVGARGRRSARKMAARKMAAVLTFLRFLGRGGAVTRGLPGGARCFGVRTSPTGEKVTHTGQV